MNAVTAHQGKLNTFKWLLKREFWEGRGGFLWAQVWAGGIVAGLYALIGVFGSIVGRSRFHVNQMTADDAFGDSIPRLVGNFGDGVMLAGIGLALAIMFFVTFFYLLGALYDERKDRSVLFWKSMPVSDTQTVLSKATWALLLAPLLALGIGICVGLVMWLVTALTMTVNGVPASMSMFTHSHPLHIVGNVLIALPVQILWSLPSVGWLLLCSAWSQNKPIRWAVLLPTLTCTLISMTDILGLHLPHKQIWYVLFQRPILSLIPGSFLHVAAGHPVLQNGDMRYSLEQLPLGASWHVFATADLWIGVVVGIAFIAAAIYLRRWRELAD